jgi:ribosomal-protein-alanine N-acetyltransferase
MDIHSLRNNEEVWKYSIDEPSKSIEESNEYLNQIIGNYEKIGYDYYALFLNDSGKYIGEAGILNIDQSHNRGLIGYNILPEYWKRGYASEAVKAFVDYLFIEKKVQRVEAYVLENNIGSRKVLIKNGFKEEGLLRDYIFIKGAFQNVYCFGLIKGDYFENN